MCTAGQPEQVKVLGRGGKVIKELLRGFDLSLCLGNFLQQVWEPILVMDGGILGSVILLISSIFLLLGPIILGSVKDSLSGKRKCVDITRRLKIRIITTKE